MVIRIRPMTEQDTSERLEQIMDLAMLANPYATKNRYREFLLTLFQKFPHFAFVIVNRTRIIGYVMGSTDRNKGEVEDIAVLPAFRGRGFGRRLMRVELTAMRKIGIRRVILWVHWRNSETIPFYYKLGFRFLRHVRDMTGPGGERSTLKRGSRSYVSVSYVAHRDRPTRPRR